MSKVIDAIDYLQSKVNSNVYVKVMQVLTKDQNMLVMKLVILAKAKNNTPASQIELESKGKEFITSLTDDQKTKLSGIVGKDVVDNLVEAIK